MQDLKRYGAESRRLAEVLDERLDTYMYSIVVQTSPSTHGHDCAGGSGPKVDLTGDRNPSYRRLDNVLAWLDRVRARPGVAAGIEWGMKDEDEVDFFFFDRWSQETREKYEKMGGKIATAHGQSKL